MVMILQKILLWPIRNSVNSTYTAFIYIYIYNYNEITKRSLALSFSCLYIGFHLLEASLTNESGTEVQLTYRNQPVDNQAVCRIG